MEQLQEYIFTMEQKRGRYHCNAGDFLSKPCENKYNQGQIVEEQQLKAVKTFEVKAEDSWSDKALRKTSWKMLISATLSYQKKNV